ncbi:MAG: hypothetical protein IT203_06725, partial [Fimbriimonadaceae bacterium]|nr:hypothetical protein [Fimbriimonadaceae bacterium]
MSVNLPLDSDRPFAPSSSQSMTDGGMEHVDLEVTKPQEQAMALAPGEFALKNQVLPLHLDGEVLVVAIGDITSLPAVDDLGILANRPVRPVLADATLIKERIEEYFLERILAGIPSDDGGGVAEIDDTTDLADLTKMAGETAVVQMVNL